MLNATCFECTIVNPLIYAHVCRNRNDDWNRLGIWAIQCQFSNYPSILIRVVGEGEFHLFLLLQYRSDVKLIPLGFVSLLVCAFVPIKQDSIFTRELSINGQIYIQHIDAIYQFKQRSWYSITCQTYLEGHHSFTQHTRVTISIQLKA